MLAQDILYKSRSSLSRKSQRISYQEEVWPEEGVWVGLERVKRGGRGNPNQIFLDRHIVSGGVYKTRDGGVR